MIPAQRNTHSYKSCGWKEISSKIPEHCKWQFPFLPPPYFSWLSIFLQWLWIAFITREHKSTNKYSLHQIKPNSRYMYGRERGWKMSILLHISLSSAVVCLLNTDFEDTFWEMHAKKLWVFRMCRWIKTLRGRVVTCSQDWPQTQCGFEDDLQLLSILLFLCVLVFYLDVCLCYHNMCAWYP